jgi:hypothetical protein
MTDQSAHHVTPTHAAPRRKGPRITRVRLVSGVVALGAAAGIIAWLVIGNGSSKQGTSGPVVAKPIAPVALSASGLRTLAGAVGQPIYWAGPKAGYLYELTRTSTGNVFIRYLPRGVKAGASGAKYLVVATYPYAGALAALQAVANGQGIKLSGGGIALVDANHPTSVHVAYPGVAYQVEVYDPSPSIARSVAVSSALRPVR